MMLQPNKHTISHLVNSCDILSDLVLIPLFHSREEGPRLFSMTTVAVVVVAGLVGASWCHSTSTRLQ